mmetsp:Transcript_28578/g.35367  ORF Transcript_28578/g.35367 Transcript_28578/m.35367 type:complete len:209 (+) Transcript_28578:1378-2004(+)
MERVDDTEKEMHRMMKYLNAVENMMSGNDLSHIKRMLDYTGQSVKHHSKAYTGIKQQVEDMNKEATSALSKISTHNSDVKRMLLESEQASRKLATKVVIHEEDSEDDAAEKQDHIHLGAERALDVSLQRQKEDIVDKLIGMNSNMRAFSSNVEEKLQRAYKAGNYAKKFGFEGMSTKNMDEDWETKSAMTGGGAGSMTAFEKILHKDN